MSTLMGAALLAAIGSHAVAASAAVEEPRPAIRSPEAVDRAQANYQAIINGKKSLFDLSPPEQEEVRELDRRLRAGQPVDPRSTYERCVDAEYEKLGREPTALDERVIDTRCR